MRTINNILPLLVLLCGTTFRAQSQNIVADSLEFAKAAAVTPATLIQGKVSGLRVTQIDGNVNGAFNTLLRGVNALRSDSQPLWVVDGVIINPALNKNKDAFFQYGEQSYTSPLNAMMFLNGYDIESINVLKDLSSISKYGIYGANGVIEITTKQATGEKFKIGWRTNIGFSAPEETVDGTTNGLSHNHFFDMSGTTGQTRYYVSAYLRSLEGIVRNNNALYGGLRANFETKANSVVWFGMNSSVTIGNMNSIAGTSYFGQPSLTMTMRDKDFFPYDTFEGWANDYDDEARDKRFTASMFLTFNFSKSLSLKNTFGTDFENNNRYIWYGNGTSFGILNNGAASLLGTSVFKYNAASSLCWNKYLFTNHHIDISATVEASGEWTKFNTLNGTDFFLHGLRAKGLNNAASKAILHKYDHRYNTTGLYGILRYDFKGIAGAEGTLRADRTPRYDDGVVLFRGWEAWFNAVKAFPSIAGSVSTLKLKAGYGEAGREQYVPYGLYDEYISGDYPRIDNDFQMFYEALNRVRSVEFSAGIDLGLLSDRITVHAGYYDKRTDDAFSAYCFGVPSNKKSHYWKYGERSDVFSQSAKLMNRGIEADVKFEIIKGKKTGLSIYANAAYNANQLLEISVADAKGRAVGNGVTVNANVVGYPVGALFAYKVGEDGSYMDLTPDGKTDFYDKDVVGNPHPEFFGGAGADFRYGAFNFEALLTGAFGFDILNLNNLLFNETAPYEIDDRYVEKGDYIRLGRVSAGLRIPTPKVGIFQAVNVSISALNLLTLTSYSGWNPEVNCFGSSYLSSGVDYGSYPMARTIIAGVKIEF